MDTINIQPVPENLEPVKQVTSEQGKLSIRDLGKGALVAVLSAVLTSIYEAIQTGGLDTIEWKTVLTVAVGALAAYLLKNWLIEPTKTIRVYKKAE